MNAESAPERWLVLEVARPPDEESAGLLVDELVLFGGGGVEETDDGFLLYLPADDLDPDEVADSLRLRLSRTSVLDGLGVKHHWQPHEAWAETWRSGFSPRRITSRLVVSPSWEDPRLEPGDFLISLDPGMAFGTAEHPTTRGALRLLDRRVQAGDRWADIGAGSGILSIAALLLGADRVVAVEMDPWSCAAASENAQINGVSDGLELLEARVDPTFLPDQPPFDGVVANIESGVLVPLLPGFLAGLRASGWLILSGILDHEAEGVIQEATSCGFSLEEDDREDGWWTGAFRADARDRGAADV